MPRIFGVQFGADNSDPDMDDTELDDPIAQTDETDEVDDELEGFDDEARTEIEAIIARREQSAREAVAQTVRSQARERGFEVAPDGSLLVADVATAQRFLGVPAPPAPAAETQKQAPIATGVDLTNIPDPTIYPEEHKRWLDAYTQQQFATLTAQHQAAQQQTQAYVAQMAAQNATTRVIGKLGEMGYGQLAQHPQFVARFQESLMNMDMSYWQDDSNLARVAFMLIPDLGAAPPAAPTRRPKTSTVPAAQVATNLAARQGMDQFAPSSPGLRAPAAEAAGDDALYARALGISVEEVRALKDESGRGYSEFKTKAKSKNRR